MNRRALLRGALASVTVGLAGCTLVSGRSVSISVENEDDATHTVEITVRDPSSGDTVLTRTKTVQAGEQTQVATVDGTEHTVKASLDSGTEQTLRLEGTPGSVVVRVQQDGGLSVLAVGDD